MSTEQLAAFIEQDHAALRAFMAGDPEPKKALYSRQHDVTLANPLGPPAKGWEAVSRRLEEAASMLQGAADLRFERVSLVETPDLAYQVEIERYDGQQIEGMDQPRQVDLRVTTAFRMESGDWRIVHRHADPITTSRGFDSVVS